MKEVNASRLISWRKSLQSQTDTKITFTDLLVKLTAAALKKHPRINSQYQNGSLLLSQEVNIGLAVAIEDGLIVPVIHHADTLSIDQIAAARIELIEGAQQGRLALESLQKGTFTISNLGMYGIDAFQAVLNPPQAAILAVGQIADRVVPVNGQPSVQPMMTLSASFDHRAVDGARGAQFLKTLADLIQEPLGLLK
jgi:pyruvate dehydrogenase E2 component (dihydrolipoamide acetyltransferase)